MVGEDREIEPLTDDEIEAVREHLNDVAFRERVKQEVRRYVSWISASIITGFAIYKAVVDVIFKKGGS